MDRAQRVLLAGLGAAVALLGAGLIAGCLWLSRLAPLDGDLRLVAGLVGAAALVMALRCGRLALGR